MSPFNHEMTLDFGILQKIMEFLSATIKNFDKYLICQEQKVHDFVHQSSFLRNKEKKWRTTFYSITLSNSLNNLVSNCPIAELLITPVRTLLRSCS